MEVGSIIAEIDSQIVKLQQARALLAESSITPSIRVPARRGRPKGSKNFAKAATNAATKKTPKTGTAANVKSKHRLSPEGRKRIAEAMKKRWAERRKQPAK